MVSIIPKPPVDIDSSNSQDSFLPPFLRLNSKITYKHDGQYHKGFMGQRDGVYRFIFKSHANKRKEEWGVNLPNLPTTGSICAFTAFLFPVMSLVLSFDQHLPLNNLHLIQLSLLSALSTSTGNALPHSSRHLRTPIWTGKYGWTLIRRKTQH